MNLSASSVTHVCFGMAPCGRCVALMKDMFGLAIPSALTRALTVEEHVTKQPSGEGWLVAADAWEEAGYKIDAERCRARARQE